MGLFSWVRRLFGRERTNLYLPKDRLIFYYGDGQRVVAADPMELWRNFEEVRGDLAAASMVARSQSKDAGKMYRKMVEYIRKIFDVKPLKEGGLTEQETTDLLNSFLLYCDELKKNSRRYPTSRTATPEPSASSSGDSPPTPSGSGSGSTEKGPSTDVPAPSPSVPASPSA